MNIEELEKLAGLKEKGIITEEQFNQKKKQILNNNQSDNNSDKKSTIDYKIDTNAIKSYSIMAIIMLLSIICSISVMICCITTVSTIVKPYNELSGWEYVSVALALTIGIFFIIKKLIAKLLNLRSDTKFIKFYKVFAYILGAISVIIVSIIIYNNIH